MISQNMGHQAQLVIELFFFTPSLRGCHWAKAVDISGKGIRRAWLRSRWDHWARISGLDLDFADAV